MPLYYALISFIEVAVSLEKPKFCEELGHQNQLQTKSTVFCSARFFHYVTEI